MNRAAFYAAVRTTPAGGFLRQPQVDGFNAILDEWDRRKLTDIRWLAYMLATAWHETAHTMQPIQEYGRGRGMRYGTTYYGRGFVQLTWEANYRKASAVVGVDLVADPDRALEMPIAAAILVDGMTKGWFTGHKLADYINGQSWDYVEARRIINGTDRAVTIAGYAVSFQRALEAATASSVPTRDQPVAVPVEPKPPPKPPSRQPDDPGPQPSTKPAASGLSHVGTGGIGTGAALSLASIAGAPMPYILTFAAGVIAGLAIAFWPRIKAAIFPGPTARPAPMLKPTPKPAGADLGGPVQAKMPSQASPLQPPVPPSASAKG